MTLEEADNGARVIQGILAATHEDEGLAVEIDIRGGDVHIQCGDTQWSADAAAVAVEYLSPAAFRLVFDDQEYVFRPDNPLHARFTLERDVQQAARRRVLRPHRPPSPGPSVGAGHTIWVESSVEIEAIKPPDEEPGFVPPPEAPAPAPTPIAASGDAAEWLQAHYSRRSTRPGPVEIESVALPIEKPVVSIWEGTDDNEELDDLQPTGRRAYGRVPGEPARNEPGRVASLPTANLRTAVARIAQPLTSLVRTYRRTPGPDPACEASHAWTSTRHGAFGVARCARCNAIEIRDDRPTTSPGDVSASGA